MAGISKWCQRVAVELISRPIKSITTESMFLLLFLLVRFLLRFVLLLSNDKKESQRREKERKREREKERKREEKKKEGRKGRRKEGRGREGKSKRKREKKKCLRSSTFPLKTLSSLARGVSC